MKPGLTSENITNSERPQWLPYLDGGLALLALLAYAFFVTGGYFVPAPYGLAASLGLLLAGLAARFYLTGRIKPALLKKLLVEHWPLLVLGLALLGAAFLRWQAIRNYSGPDGQAGLESLAGAAQAIINNSDWRPKSYSQPPLYLFLSALVAELQFLQQSSAGKIVTTAELNPAELVPVLSYVNLLLGVVGLVPVYAAATRLWNSRRAGAVAALLLAGSWLAYQAVPQALPQTLAAVLAATGFYFMVRGWQEQSRWPYWWAGMLAGLATAAAYGAVLLLVPLTLGLLLFRTTAARPFKLVTGWGGWLLGFSLGAPGWVLSLPQFLNGLAGTGQAPAGAPGAYLKEALSGDAGLLLGLAAALVAAFSLTGGKATRLWLVLSFPLLYGLLVAACGPLLVERLALAAPFAAIAAALPPGLAAGKLQAILDKQDDRHRWAGAALAVGLAVFLLLLSVLARRFFL